MPKSAKSKSELTPRQRNLLFAVIKEYCEFGLTVSSKDLKEKYGFAQLSEKIQQIDEEKDQAFLNDFLQIHNSAFDKTVQQL